ncbi:MAG: DUF308 domain-containing protein [Mogibacterium sp.]|nr:DUF308 domain-containing protein [Mogibacterium sp.]
MTKLGRVTRVFTGIIIMLFAVILFIMPPEDGIRAIAGIMSLMFTIRGIQTLFYYVSMARSMVGGKFMLYRGIIYLDIGIFTTSMTNTQPIYVILYLAAVHTFSGVINLLRIKESRSVGSKGWRMHALLGITNFILAWILIAGGFITHSLNTILYIYAGGLVYTAVMRIISAFRRTAIVYIQ